MTEPQDLDAYDPKNLTTLPGDYVYATGVGLLGLSVSTNSGWRDSSRACWGQSAIPDVEASRQMDGLRPAGYR